MKKVIGWILVTLSLLWALTAVVGALKSEASISYMLGAVTLPILVGLLGLYLAGVIKKLK